MHEPQAQGMVWVSSDLSLQQGLTQMTTLQEGIDFLYNKAVVEGKATSPMRMKVVGEYCIQELASRGLTEGCLPEQNVPGHLRSKKWDVAYELHGKHRLVASLKSILSNLRGTVPNRGDDLMGEASNVQLFSPEIVTGYLMVFDTREDAYSDKYSSTWKELMSKRLERISGRRAPSWGFGLVEALQGWKSPGYDAVAPDDRRVQIKARCILPDAKAGQRVGSIRLDHEWDTVALILMNEDFEPLEIYEAERRDIEEALLRPGSKARNERGALSVRQFKAIADLRWTAGG